MKQIYLIIFLFICSVVSATEIDKYLLHYRETQKSDHSVEKEIVEKTKLNKLINTLKPYYSDTLPGIRQKAYYLTYKKGIKTSSPAASKAVDMLINGCSDQKSGIVNQNINYLKQFPKTRFSSDATARLATLLTNRKLARSKDLILLAGYTGAAKDILLQKFISEDTPEEVRFYAACALSRMGEEEQTNYCVNTLKNQAVNNQTVAYLIPLAIYTRQKKTIDYCIEIINSNEKGCSSPNPDYSGEILCAYRVIELLAPVINDFPIKINKMGSIQDISYEKALKVARKWLSENASYTLNTTNF